MRHPVALVLGPRPVRPVCRDLAKIGGDCELLLAELLAHSTQPRFVYTHRWRPGDLVMWDNRCLLHRAVLNYDTARDRRVMHRSVVNGPVPV